MKQLLLTGLSFVMIFMHFSCSAQTDQKQASAATEVSNHVAVYYFHFTRRCSTCIAVEENSKKAVEELYPEQFKSGEYTFTAINLDEESSKEVADKLGVSMQTLLVVHGGTKIDITGEGFMYAHDLDKLKEEIKKAVEKAVKA
jgi:hypothetical protein